MKYVLSAVFIVFLQNYLWGNEKIADSLNSSKNLRNEIQIVHDNDLYLMILQDQYYTNGLHLNYRWLGEKEKIKHVYMSHKMYNPFTAQADSIEVIDRPFAAEFLMGYKIQNRFKPNQFLVYGVELGVMGEMAAGKVLQENLHELLNMYHPDGWQYQLKNSIGLDLHAEYALSAFRIKRNFEGILHGKLVAGTQHLRSSLSGIFRLGIFNSMNSSSFFNSKLGQDETQSYKELYLYNATNIHWIGYDVTLQGGRFREDKGVVLSEPIPFQYSNEFGLAFSNRKLDFRIGYTFKTKEAEKSLFRHQYGTTSLAMRF